MKPIKVLIVDDSAVVRKVLTDLLSIDPEISVIGSAADPIFAKKHMEKEWPDVLVLDVEMPRMDGITFLRNIMAEHPTPVIICSTLTEKGAETTLQALSAGAVEIIGKPKIGLKSFIQEEQAMFIHAVKSAARVNPSRLKANIKKPTRTTPSLRQSNASPTASLRTTERIVAIGTSTGGTQALEHVLSALPRTAPGIVVVQHMPAKFTKAFAARLNSVSAVNVIEASNGDRVIPGRVLIAPGGHHMKLRGSGAQYHVEVFDGPVVNRHRPSVDVLFRSTAKTAGGNALGVIMTGMGNDGARGLLEMHQAGAQTLAQDEASCVVYGMPKEAVKLGGTDDIVDLGSIAEKIMHFAHTKS
ncbi:chemotaxis response regulator protein-glutamate methylesterase [Pseudomonadota bacterium]